MSLGAKIGSLKEDLSSLWAMLGKRDGLDAAAEVISHKPLRAQVRGGAAAKPSALFILSLCVHNG